MPSEAPMSRDPDETRALVFGVYREVWDEFNKWKVENSEQQLLLLQKPLPPPGAAEDALLEASDLREGEPGEVEIIYLCESEDDTPLHPGGSTVLMCETVHLELPPDFAPHPRYESCTPAVQSIAFRPGSSAEDELDILPFVPYADDPTFDVEGYLGMFKYFAWEYLGDPDTVVIQFETLRRLYFGNGLSLDEIDATGILPQLRVNNRDGLIYKMTQRDELFWPGMMVDFPIDGDGVEQRNIDFRAHEPNIDNLRGRLDSIVPYFCANPGCIQAFCPRHVMQFLPVPQTAPRVTSDDYPDGESCGSMCFREIDDTSGESSVEWVEQDIDELRCILEIIPDTLPCGLAKLVRKPCREVYIQRRRLIPDDTVYPESAKARSSTKIRYRDDKTNFENENLEYYLSPGPCSHTGPCDQSNPSCTCVEESVHCTRSCQCGVTCQRREGCRCKLTPKKSSMQRSVTCADNKCPCRKRGWECDPSVCECDNLTYLKYLKRWTGPKNRNKKPLPRRLAPDGEHYCQNSDIQRGLAAEVEIKRGAYGLGAFAVNRIRAHQFIGEYIGELVPHESSQKEALRIHLDLNYNFGYDPNYSLDSARVGNETRYINHGSAADGTVNADAESALL
jgi:histone-lysine N-methyltransferase EZH2